MEGEGLGHPAQDDSLLWCGDSLPLPANDRVVQKSPGTPDTREEVGAGVFEALLPHRSALHRFIRRLVGMSWDADDIVQEAYLRLLERPARQRDARTPAGYLFVIARNLVADRRRRSFREDKRTQALRVLSAHLDDTGPSLDELVFVEQASERIRRALNDLPDRMREVFLLHRLEGLRHEQIAALFGITTRTVERDVAAVVGHLKRTVFSSEGR